MIARIRGNQDTGFPHAHNEIRIIRIERNNSSTHRTVRAWIVISMSKRNNKLCSSRYTTTKRLLYSVCNSDLTPNQNHSVDLDLDLLNNR